MILEQGEKRARGAGGAGGAGEAGGDENSCKEEAVENSSYPLVPIPNSQFPIPNFNLSPQILPICAATAVDLPPHLRDDP